MNRSVLIAGVAVLAAACTSIVEPIGRAPGNAGTSGTAGVGGIAGFGGSGGIAGAAGAAGFAGSGGFAGAAGFGAGGVGDLPPDAGSCDDGDPCTIDYLLGDGQCFSEWDDACGTGGYGGAGSGGFAGEAGGGAIGGGGGISGDGGFGGSAGFGGAGAGGFGGCGEMGFDSDGDGYQNSVCGSDCDDTDANAFPWQQSFFTVPRISGGYDYDCDGQVSLRWGELHNGCTVDPTFQTCIGSGWTSPDMNMAFLPGCGQSAEFAFCQFTGTGCAVSMHIVTQACR